jgi:hypothetical protein
MAEQTRAAPGAGASGQLIEERANHRRTVLRMAALYTPAALVAVGLAGASVFNMLTSSWAAVVGVLLFSPVAFATSYQAITALRDLGAQPVVTRGILERAWDKGTVLWLTRSYYALVTTPRADGREGRDRHVFVISQEAYLQLEEGSNVEIEHWPHTHTVIRVSRIARPRARSQRSSSRPTR